MLSQNALLTAMVSTKQLTIILLIVTGIFVILIGAAIIKMYKLKAENKRLIETNDYKNEIERSYQDFTEGHLYDNHDKS